MGTLTDDSELALHESITEEYTQLTGTRIKLYSVRLGGSLDPVWDEPSKLYGHDPLWGEDNQPIAPSTANAPEKKEWAFNGPWEFYGFIEFEEAERLATTIVDSIRDEWEAACWIPRKSLDDIQAPYPKKGDVLHAVEWKSKTGDAVYFDVVSAKLEGALADTQSYVQFILELKRREVFDPKRRVDAGEAGAACQA